MKVNIFVLSKAKSDFQTQRISSMTSESLDKEKYSLDNKEDFTSLKQLLIDIESDDNEAYRRINREREETMPEIDFY
jgi:hypothetical protein